MASITLKLRMASSIGEITAEAWDACANPVGPAKSCDAIAGFAL